MQYDKLTPERIRQAIEAENYHYANAARSLGATPDQMRAQMHKHRRHGHTFPAPRGCVIQNERFYEPTPDEIRRACEEIRSKWPPGEHQKRARWAIFGTYEIPRVTIEDDSRDDIW